MRSAGTHFHVVGLQQRTAALAPVALQGEDGVLKGGFQRRVSGFSESRILTWLAGDSQSTVAVDCDERLSVGRGNPVNAQRSCIDAIDFALSTRGFQRLNLLRQLHPFFFLTRQLIADVLDLLAVFSNRVG